MTLKSVARVCPTCKQTTFVTVPTANYEAWCMGVCIQNAWPTGSVAEYETLITGLCPECQSETIKELEEDEQG